MEVDKWAKFKYCQPEFITKTFYGIIEFFFLYDFDGQKEMLTGQNQLLRIMWKYYLLMDLVIVIL